VTIAGQEQPPRRFVAAADAIGIAEQKASLLGRLAPNPTVLIIMGAGRYTICVDCLDSKGCS